LIGNILHKKSGSLEPELLPLLKILPIFLSTLYNYGPLFLVFLGVAPLGSED
jgi:hypothetical protein